VLECVLSSNKHIPVRVVHRYGNRVNLRIGNPEFAYPSVPPRGGGGGGQNVIPVLAPGPLSVDSQKFIQIRPRVIERSRP